MLLLISCVEKHGPMDKLKAFEYELSKSGKVDLKNYLSQKAIDNFEIKNDIVGSSKIKKINFVYNNCHNETCSFTYDVSYLIKSNNLETEMDVRKQAVLKNNDGDNWLIDEIEIIKTYINNKKIISI